VFRHRRKWNEKDKSHSNEGKNGSDLPKEQDHFTSVSKHCQPELASLN